MSEPRVDDSDPIPAEEPRLAEIHAEGEADAHGQLERPMDASTFETVQGLTFPLLWYTSNSPITTGQRDCAMRRYLGQHAGTHGTGYAKLKNAIPLATGGAVHTGVQLIGEWIHDYQRAHPGMRLTEVPHDVTAWAAMEAATRYETGARAKGLELTHGDTDALAANEILILEQRTLIEALVWVYALARLPVMLATHRVLLVEMEQGPVLDCSCGLGDWVGNWTHHGPRGCHGIVSMGRTDVLWERVDDGAIVYDEIKTKASERLSWEQAFEHSSQLWLNMEGATRALGREVNVAYVPILMKGWRGRDKGQPPTQPKYQHSPLVYGYFDAGAPPMREAEWSSRYRWTDDYGKTHQLPRSFTKVPIWDEQFPLITQGMREGASRVETWVRNHIPDMQWADLIKTIGPFPRPVQRLGDATAALLAEERMWRERVSILRENKAYEAAHPLVIELIPRSWNCTGYDGTPCPFKRVCDKEPGWDQIETMGYYEHRRPHHSTEREAFEALGRVFPVDAFEEEAEGDE